MFKDVPLRLGGVSRDEPPTAKPVIRRIGDRDLYLGDELAADPEYHDREFDFVLSATRREQPLTTHHHPLRDGPGNDPADFARAVDTARALYDREGSVLVHCAAGISRSTTLVATVLAAEEGHAFTGAVAEVREHRARANPHPALRELATAYLADGSG